MEAKLIPATSSVGIPCDTINGVINLHYKVKGEKFYFTLHPELSPEETNWILVDATWLYCYPK